MNEQPLVEVRDNPQLARYEAFAGDELAGYARYELEEGIALFYHTEMLPGFAGRGVGGALARGALDDVRSRGLRVVPECPFIRGYIAKHREYVDLVPPAVREEFDL